MSSQTSPLRQRQSATSPRGSASKTASGSAPKSLSKKSSSAGQAAVQQPEGDQPMPPPPVSSLQQTTSMTPKSPLPKSSTPVSPTPAATTQQPEATVMIAPRSSSQSSASSTSSQKSKEEQQEEEEQEEQQEEQQEEEQEEEQIPGIYDITEEIRKLEQGLAKHDSNQDMYLTLIAYQIISYYGATDPFAKNGVKITDDEMKDRVPIMMDKTFKTGELIEHKDALLKKVNEQYLGILSGLGLLIAKLNAGQLEIVDFHDLKMKLQYLVHMDASSDPLNDAKRSAGKQVVEWAIRYLEQISLNQAITKDDVLAKDYVASFAILGLDMLAGSDYDEEYSRLVKAYLEDLYYSDYGQGITRDAAMGLLTANASTSDYLSVYVIQALGKDVLEIIYPLPTRRTKQSVTKTASRSTLSSSSTAKKPLTSPMSPSVTTPTKSVFSPTSSTSSIPKRSVQPSPSQQETLSVESILGQFSPISELAPSSSRTAGRTRERGTRMTTSSSRSPSRSPTTSPSRSRPVPDYKQIIISKVGKDGFEKIVNASKIDMAKEIIDNKLNDNLVKLVNIITRNMYFKNISDAGFDASNFKDLDTAALKAVADEAQVRGKLLRRLSDMASESSDNRLKELYTTGINLDTNKLQDLVSKVEVLLKQQSTKGTQASASSKSRRQPY